MQKVNKRQRSFESFQKKLNRKTASILIVNFSKQRSFLGKIFKHLSKLLKLGDFLNIEWRRGWDYTLYPVIA